MKFVGPVIFALVKEVMLVLNPSYDATETYATLLTGAICKVTLEILVAVTIPPPEEIAGKLKFP